MSDHPQTRDLLGPYVIGELPADEEQVVEDHLERCAACRQEADSLRLVHESLVEFAAVTETPPPHLKARAVSGMPGPASRPAARKIPSWLAAAAAALLVALGIAYGTSLFGGGEVAAATLEPTREAPGAGGEVEILGGGENMEVHLEAWGLPPCEREEYYELWLVEGEERVSAGSFSVGSSGKVEVILNAPRFADSYPRIGITAEKDRDPNPGSAKMLGGELRRF